MQPVLFCDGILSCDRACPDGSLAADQNGVGMAPNTGPLESRLHSEDSTCKRLLVISDQVDEHEMLKQAVNSSTRVVCAAYSEDTLTELFQKMSQVAGDSKGHLESIGFLDHGSASGFCLLEGQQVSVEQLKSSDQLRKFWIDVASLLRPSSQSRVISPLEKVQQAGRVGRLDLLGCNVASEGAKSNPLVLELQEITGLNVCASTDITGAAEEGGNWILETDGINAAEVYFVEDQVDQWRHKLDYASRWAHIPWCVKIFCCPCICFNYCRYNP